MCWLQTSRILQQGLPEEALDNACKVLQSCVMKYTCTDAPTRMHDTLNIGALEMLGTRSCAYAVLTNEKFKQHPPELKIRRRCRDDRLVVAGGGDGPAGRQPGWERLGSRRPPCLGRRLALIIARGGRVVVERSRERLGKAALAELGRASVGREERRERGAWRGE